MRRLVKTITISAAIAASAALGAVAAPAVAAEVGVVIEGPTASQTFFYGPVTLKIKRSAKWDEVKDAYGYIPGSDPYTFYVDVHVQRNEGGQWQHLIKIFKPFYGPTLEENLWSLSSYGAAPMGNIAGMQQYRVRAQSYYNYGVTNLTEWTGWVSFAVKAPAVVAPTSAGDIPGISPKPSIEPVEVPRLRPVPEVGPLPPGPLEPQSIERESIEIERVAPDRITR